MRKLLLLLPALAAAPVMLYLQEPPRPGPAGAPNSEFSSGRAMAHVRRVAARPHPTGSEANAGVREYITAQLSGLDLRPEIQTAVGMSNRGNGTILSAVVHNVVGRLPGRTRGKAVMLATHYDSVPTAPGASDAGHAVAVLLETVRALRQGPPLENDLIVLFTDGEELYCLGAEAFTSQHPWARDAAVVLNFEARGTGGPGLMFETSAGNGWLIRNFASAAPHPVSSSLFYDFYKRLPNDTDLTVFKRAGVSGLNFAYIGGGLFYHTPMDDLSHIDERSLQHQGSYALSLARQFGNEPLGHPRAPNSVYFSVPGLGLVAYPERYALPLSIAVCVALGWLVLGSKVATLRGTTAGTAAALIAVAGAALAAEGWWQGIRALHAGRFAQGIGPYRTWPYELGFLFLAFAIVAAVYGFASRRWKPLDLVCGALVCWCAVGLASALVLPGASYLFAWPAVFALIGIAARRPWAGAIFAVPAVAIWTPLFPLLWAAMGLGISPAVVAGIGLLGTLVLPYAGISNWRLPAACAAGVLLCIAGAGIGPAFDGDHPQADSLFYSLDADNGSAVWASWDDAPDEWTASLLTSKPRRAAVPLATRPPSVLAHPAPAAPLAAPVVTVVNDASDQGRRILTLRVRSLRPGVEFITLFTAGAARLISIGGRAVQGQPPVSRIRITAAPAEGMELKIFAPPRLRLDAFDASPGMPESGGPRPAWLMAAPLAFNGASVVHKSFEF